jgi:tripartite-type tricarboxylate transporter receptor subunit TctC
MDRRTAVTALGAAVASLAAGAVRAQSISNPMGSKPLRMIVGFPAGGVADFVARAIGEGLRQAWNHQVIVENRPGAGGNIALEFIARQSADAGTIGIFPNASYTMNPLVPQLSVKGLEPARDLVVVSAVADMILLMAVTTQLGVKNLDEFLARARATDKPPLRVGIAGTGTPHHLSAALLEHSTKYNYTMVPYRGGPPMVADAAGGHLDVVFSTLPVTGPMVDAGKMRWIAIVQPTTIKSLPELPSLAKTVFKGLTVPSWVGMFAPSAMPAEQVAGLHAAINAVAASPAISERLRSNGLEPLGLSQVQTAALLRDEGKAMRELLDRVKVDFST